MSPSYNQQQDKIMATAMQQLQMLSKAAPALAACDKLAAKLNREGQPTSVVCQTNAHSVAGVVYCTAEDATAIGYLLIEWGYSYTNDAFRIDDLITHQWRVAVDGHWITLLAAEKRPAIREAA